jgi:hypothetical protein
MLMNCEFCEEAKPKCIQMYGIILKYAWRSYMIIIPQRAVKKREMKLAICIGSRVKIFESSMGLSWYQASREWKWNQASNK